MEPLIDDVGLKPLYRFKYDVPDLPAAPKAIYYVVEDALLEGLHEIVLVDLRPVTFRTSNEGE